MKKCIIGFCLLLVSLPLSYAADLDVQKQARALQAEADRHDAEIAAFNARCGRYIIGSALEAQCEAEDARLKAWGQSILARARALPAGYRRGRAAAPESTTSGAFGTKNANPKLVPAEKGTVGTNRKAGDQLKAAAKEARRGDQSDFRKNYDEGGAQGDGSLVDGRGSKQDPVIPPGLQNDPKIASAVTKRDAARRDIQQIETQLKTLSPSNPKDQVKIAQLKDKEQRDERRVQYENYSIGDQISGGKKKK